ncbi:MAG: extracellular solute-binding protein [Chloroflexales bacterium]|nr:extracellular solute-binding protein [Chloroflexales bacterium]
MINILRPMAVLLVAALLFACGDFNATPQASPTPDTAEPAAMTPEPTMGSGANADQPVTITFGMYEFERSIYEPLIEAFHRENPTIRVQLVSLDKLWGSIDFNDYNAAMRKLASAADVVSAPLAAMKPELITNGYIRDLAPFIEADPTFDRDDFFPSALEAYENGAIGLLPGKMNVQLLAYNRDLWAARGLDRPDPNWTWDDLLSAAARIAQKNGHTIEVYGFMESRRSELLRNGEISGLGDLLVDVAPETVQLDSPEVVAAMERVMGLFADGIVYTPPQIRDGSILTADDFMPLIREQKIGMWPDGFEQFASSDSLLFDIGIAPYPLSFLPSQRISTQGYIMSGGTPYPEQAWRWLDFISRQAIYQTDFRRVGDMPARQSVAEASGYWDQLDVEARTAIETTLARQSVAPTWLGSERQQIQILSQALNTAMGAVLDEDKSPEEALRAAQADLTERLANAQLTPTAELDTSPIVVATPLPEVVAATNTTPITFGNMGFGIDQMNQVAQAFNQEFPAFFVTVKTIEQSGDDPLTLADVAATTDCFASWLQIREDDDRAALLDLQPLIDADPTFDLGDYPAMLLALFEQDGKRYGLPYDFMFRVLNYNQDAFDAAGLVYPTADWTLNDFVGAAQQLTQGNGADRQYGFVGGDRFDLFFFLARSGVIPVTGSDATLAPNFTDSQLQAAIESYLDFLRTASPHQQLHYANSQSPDESYRLRDEGRAAMWFGYGFEPDGSSIGESRFTRGVAPTPLGDGTLDSSDFFTTGVFISANTPHSNGCWQWIQYLSANNPAFRDRFPAKISLAASEAFLDQAPAGAAEIYTAYQAAFARTNIPVESVYRPAIDHFWLFRAIDRALQGADLTVELADAQFLTKQWLACVRGGEAPDFCARQVDPDYASYGR